MEVTAVDSVKQMIARRPVAAFLLILYPISWILFVPSLLGRSGLGVLPVDVPAQAGILLVTIFGPCGVTTTSFALPRSGTSSPFSEHRFSS